MIHWTTLQAIQGCIRATFNTVMWSHVSAGTYIMEFNKVILNDEGLGYD